MNDKEDCPNCKGSGKQVFHGHFDSIMGRCNFCGGSGNLKDYLNFVNKPHTCPIHKCGGGE